MGKILKNLEDWLEYLETIHPTEIELGLDRIKKVGNRIKGFDFSCPVVTVAGTNGKGSTVAILAKLLKQAGLKVATYTSPHLLRFNERIQYDGRPISDQALCAAFKQVEQARMDTTLTFFEFTTLAAFVFFQQIASLDVLILEVGIGGRLDAVNTIDPTLAIVTSISYDHQELLGYSLDLIAKEKAGIIRPFIPVVLGETAAREIVLEQLVQNHNPCYIEGKDFKQQQIMQWQCNEQSIAFPQSTLPPRSISLAFAAYHLLANQIILPDLKTVATCLEKTQMMGRYFQCKIGNTDIILDVAHNPEGSEWLAKRLRQKNKKWVAIWASLKDKSHDDMLPFFKDIIHTWYIADLGKVKRKTSMPQLSLALQKIGAQTIFDCPTIKEALAQAINQALPGEGIVVWGSFYTVAQVLKEISSDFMNYMNNNGIRVMDEIPACDEKKWCQA